MLLDELVTVIETLKGRMTQYQTELGKSEALTRYVLIDPLLHALGWDLGDPGQVRPEYSGAGGGLADYALLGDSGADKPEVIVEAKSLASPLTDNVVNQAFQYCFQRGIGHMVVTNGNSWRLFELLSSGTPMPDREMASITLNADPSHQCALKLLLLWRPNLASGRPIPASEPILSGAFQNTPTTTEPVVNPQPPVTPPPTGEGWTPLTDFLPENSSQPPHIRLPDGTEKQLQHWYGVLLETAEWLIRAGQLTPKQCPVTNNGKVSIVHTEPRHQSGNTFHGHHTLSNGLFLNKHGSRRRMLDYTRLMLARCGQNPVSVLLKSN